MQNDEAGFRQIAVVGAGQMGAGIAQVCAQANMQVFVFDQNKEQLEKAKLNITNSLSKFVEKEKISVEQKTKALASLSFTAKLDDLKTADLLIEAIVENEKIKGDLFAEVDRLLKPSAIIASNTSSIPITRLASRTQRPDKFVGMHFMNPVPLMRLVEVISGMATSQETTERIVTLAQNLGKEVSKSLDYPGFVVNRILMPMINEAFNVLMENIATAEDIDKGMKLGTNQPMGPLTLADFIGLDTCYAIMRVLYDGTYDPRYRPSPLLAKYVEAGYLGRKSGRGVYNYKAI